MIFDTKVSRSGRDQRIVNFSNLYFQPASLWILIRYGNFIYFCKNTNLFSLTWMKNLSLILTHDFFMALCKKSVCSGRDRSGRDKNSTWNDC